MIGFCFLPDGNSCGTSPRATCQCFTRTPLNNTNICVIFIIITDDFHISLRAILRVPEIYTVRVAQIDIHVIPCDLFHNCFTHGHRHPTRCVPGLNQPVCQRDGDRILRKLLHQIIPHTTQSITTIFRLRAIRIVNQHQSIRLRVFFQQQKLITPYTQVPVTHMLNQPWCECRQGIPDTIQDNKIVTLRLHFNKRNPQPYSILGVFNFNGGINTTTHIKNGRHFQPAWVQSRNQIGGNHIGYLFMEVSFISKAPIVKF